MQPYLFPYLGYFQLIYAVDTFVLYDNLDFIRYGWVNRNRLLAVNGPPFYVIVPVRRKSPSRKIKDIQIADGSWRRKLLNSIYVNYNRAAYFEEVFPVLEHIIQCKTDSLSRLNKVSVVDIATYLNMDTDILVDPKFDWLEEKLSKQSAHLTSAFPYLHLSEPSVKVIRAIEICRALNAKTLVNPIGGIVLYPKAEFERNDLTIWFLIMREVRYPQNSTGFKYRGHFYPRLSIIDVLMNCGKEGTSALLHEFMLV